MSELKAPINTKAAHHLIFLEEKIIKPLSFFNNQIPQIF